MHVHSVPYQASGEPTHGHHTQPVVITQLSVVFPLVPVQRCMSLSAGDVSTETF